MTGTIAYTPSEVDLIGRLLADGLSAAQIADRLSCDRRTTVTRNAIIGVVMRNAALAAIGFARKQGDSRKSVPAAQRLHAGNIRGKKEGRAFDPGFTAPAPRAIADEIAPGAYDEAAQRLPLDALKPSDCRFPVNHAGMGEMHLFCAAPRDGVRPYCPHHCRRAGAGYVAAQTGDFRTVLKQTA